MDYIIDIIDNLKALSLLETRWNYLYTECLIDNVFLTFSWVKSWSEFNIKECEPFVLTISDSSGNIIGIAPLGIKKHKRLLANNRTLTFLAHGPSDYQDFLIPSCNQHIINKIIDTIIENRKKWDTLELHEFPYNSKTLQLLLNSKRVKFQTRVCNNCPQIAYNEDSTDYEQYFSKKRKKDTLQKLRRLERIGKLEIKTVTDENEVLEFMNNFIVLHKKRWNCTETKSHFNESQCEMFFKLLALEMFGNGFSNYTYLTFDDKIIAIHFGFQSKEKLYYYMSAFDAEYAKHSVGIVFLYLLIKSGHQKNLKTFDFLRGNENYKDYWGSTSYSNTQITHVKNSWKGLMTILYYLNEDKQKSSLYISTRKNKEKIVSTFQNTTTKINTHYTALYQKILDIKNQKYKITH